MSASLSDINFVVIHKGKKRYWAGMKSCGHVILDIRFGLYGEKEAPDLSWIDNSMWGEMLIPLDAALEDPIYGEVVVDFDRKLIIDLGGYGSPLEIIPGWLAMTWEDPEDAPISKESLRHHLMKRRVRALSAKNVTSSLPGEIIEPSKNAGFLNLKKKMDIENFGVIAFEERIVKFAFDLPIGWTLTRT